MTDTSARAPLFVDALAIAQWLVGHFDGAAGVLGPRIVAAALDLLQAVTLALKDRRREEQIELADEHLIRLRVLLRLASECGNLTAEQHGHVLARVDAIGRQLGGWQRSLGPV